MVTKKWIKQEIRRAHKTQRMLRRNITDYRKLKEKYKSYWKNKIYYRDNGLNIIIRPAIEEWELEAMEVSFLSFGDLIRDSKAWLTRSKDTENLYKKMLKFFPLNKIFR